MSFLLDRELAAQVDARWNSLTKPPGSLGRLEALVRRYALIRGEAMPGPPGKGLYLFCGDHGVVEEGVSAFPQEVTRQMVRNFLHGGAAITVLCRHFRIEPIVVDAGVIGPPEEGVLNRKVGHGTRNFRREPAMTLKQAEHALAVGRELADEAAGQFDVAGVGEMGIGNTTAAAALLCAFAGAPPEEAVGRGTGVDDDGLARKAAVIRDALALHHPDPADPVSVLAAMGGFEIAAMAGFILGAAERRLPVVLDGFITCSAALVARAINPDALSAVIFSHQSAENGHARMLARLGAEPLFSLDMRLGEGTGAALAINLLDSSLALYREMATFAEARVASG